MSGVSYEQVLLRCAARTGTADKSCSSLSASAHFSPPCSERIMRTATNISNDNLALLGTCFGRFTKSKRFRLKVTCLEILAKYALVRLISFLAPHRSTHRSSPRSTKCGCALVRK